MTTEYPLDDFLKAKIRKTTFEDVEAYMIEAEKCDLTQGHEKWLKFKQKATDSIEIWTYDDIRCLSGSKGILLVQDGHVLDGYVIWRS